MWYNVHTIKCTHSKRILRGDLDWRAECGKWHLPDAGEELTAFSLHRWGRHWLFPKVLAYLAARTFLPPPHQGHAHLCPTWGLVWPRPGCRARDGLVSLAYGPGAQLQQKQGEPTCELGRSLPLVSMRVSQQAWTSVRPPLLAAGSTALSVLPNLSKPISWLDWRRKYFFRMKVKIKWDNPQEIMRWELTLCQPRISWLSLWTPAIQDCLHTHPGSERHHNQKWAVGAKVCLRGRLQDPFHPVQHAASQLRQGCSFFMCFLNRARGNKGKPSQHHSTIPGSQWNCQSTTKV